MLYTIGEMSKKLGIPASTLRYYEKEQLLPCVERTTGGIRMFKESDLEFLRIVNCLKKPGHLMEEMEECDAVLTGEICEWAQGEPVRDMAELALEKKALLVMSHIGSERDGMRLTAERICEHFPGIEARYFECGEVYRR